MTVFLALFVACNGAAIDDTDPVQPDDLVGDDFDAGPMLDHLGALEDIADAQQGNRAYLSGGYDGSVTYIIEQLEDAGYTVTTEAFDLSSFSLNDVSASQIQEGGNIAIGVNAFEYSGSGTVEASVVAVDVTVPPGAPNSSTSGCETSDFDAFPAGSIALLQRGTCTFSVKAGNAIDAGAAAVLIFNEGQQGRQERLEGTLGNVLDADVPVVGLSYNAGIALVDGGTISVTVDATITEASDVNVFVETAGDPTRTVLVGAHLDSVEAGAGINDNGSGSAFILEAALRMADASPRNRVKFAWWGAEEQGLLGSQAYFIDGFGDPRAEAVDGLDAYLNFDMMASGNGVRFVYDGDESDFVEGLATPGSAEIETMFLEWFDARDLETGAESLLIPTDSYWTAILGIPTGGVFSGAFGVKSELEAETFGGDSGIARDPCYHLECDRIDNIDPGLYAEMAGASWYVIETLSEREAPLPMARRMVLPQDIPLPSGCHDHTAWDR